MNLLTFLMVTVLSVSGSDSYSQGQIAQAGTQQPQQREITGIVTDTDGLTLPGVSVIVKGTMIGTVTNARGEFSMNVPLNAETLQFSFVGMQTKEMQINGRTVFLVSMEEDMLLMDEVVFIAYGTQTKESVIGAISSVSPSELRQTSSVSLSSALAGRISGLSAIAGSGQPGFDDATLLLRGVATLNDASPLIVIDGVPRENIRQLHPSEIESISVLKDASATSVFGVRGANGAIIITTRRGAEGKGKLTINAEQGYSSFTKEPERLRSVEYFRLRNEAANNDGLESPFSEEIIEKYRNPLAGLDPNDPDYASQKALREYMYPDHDYYRMFISQFTPQSRINANLSGGTDKLRYYMYTGFIYQGGNFKTDPESFLGYDPSIKMNRISFRANLDYKVTQSLSTFLNLSSSIERVNMPSPWRSPGADRSTMILQILQDSKRMLPWSPGPTTIEGFGIDPGQTIEMAYLNNSSAYRYINRNGFRTEIPAVSNSSVGANWDLGKLVTPGLKVNGMVSFDSWASTILQGNATFPYYNAEVNYETDQLSFSEVSDEEAQIDLSKSARSRYAINAQARINYDRMFQKHAVGGMILVQRDYWESYAADIPYNVLGIAGRATYNYDNRYYTEVNIGYNGSEQFAPDQRFGFFPAVSLGWVISNENFLRDHDILTFLKLRGSYGKAGNDKISNERFLFQDDIQLGGGVLPSLGRNQSINMGLLGNPFISWEVSWKRNFGVDFNILHDLSGSVDYFFEDRSEILITRGLIPAFQGVPLGNIPKANMGEVENQGFDIELRYNKNISRDISFTLGGNFGRYKNRVNYADEPIRDEDYAYRYRTTGFALGQNWGYQIDWNSNGGFWTSQEEIDNSGITYDFGTPRPGDFKYIDQNNDGVINDRDMVPIGYSSRNPEFIYGITLSTKYKGLDFMVFVQGVGNYSSYYSGVGVWENSALGSYMGYHKQAWTQERFENNEKITYPALTMGSSTNHIANDFFIMDRSYIRLRNVEIGYTLSKGKLASIGVNSLRVYAAGQNLFTWDKLEGEMNDPESENRRYPTTKIVNFGLQINF